MFDFVQTKLFIKTRDIIQEFMNNSNFSNKDCHYFANRIYTILSGKISHFAPNHDISKYTTQVIIHSLLDLMLWANTEINKRKQKKGNATRFKRKQ